MMHVATYACNYFIITLKVIPIFLSYKYTHMCINATRMFDERWDLFGEFEFQLNVDAGILVSDGVCAGGREQAEG